MKESYVGRGGPLLHGSLVSSPKKTRRRSTTSFFVKGLLLTLLAIAVFCVLGNSSSNSYINIWLTQAEFYTNWGDDGVLDEYPDKSAKMRLADIPPPRTGQRKEPSLREAFPLLKWPEPVPAGSKEAIREDISEEIETIHLRNTTQEEVDYYVTRGYVVVVDDMARNNKLLGWSCETYAEKWPDGLMRGEYPAPWVMNNIKEGFMIRLKQTNIWIDTIRPAWIRTFTLGTCALSFTCSNYISNGAKSAPYVWHVKTPEETPKEMQESLQVHWKAPYYMKDAYSIETAMDTFEMWFAPVGAGTYAHSDRYCETYGSMQLKGSKEWRIMNPGPRVDTYKDRIRYEDAEIYAETSGKEDQQFTPELRVTVPEGGGIIFPPYSYHETVTNNAECSVSTTFSHDTPVASRYLRQFMPRLLNQHLGYEVGCHRYWDNLTLWTMRNGHNVVDASGKPVPEPTQEYLNRDANYFGESKLYKVLPTTDKTLMTARYQKILYDVDKDNNGVIDSKELMDFLSTYENRFERYESAHREFLAYYDLDDSGDITKEELWDGWEHWNINSAYAILTHMGGLWNHKAPRKPWW